MSIISTILNVESSGGHNVTQGNIGDINNQTGDLAQGYFQIIGATWAGAGGTATGYNSALSAPYATQLQVAQNIPVNQWGPNTITQLGAAGYHPIGNETLGQMLTRYGENPASTIPADGASPTGGTMAAGDPGNASSGIAAGSGAGSVGGIDPATGLPASVTDAAGAVTSGASGAGSGTQGQQVNLGLQKSLFTEIQTWLGGLWSDTWKSITATFDNIQNWFVRAFVIIVGLVVLAIGLIKVTGHNVSDVVVAGGELVAA